MFASHLLRCKHDLNIYQVYTCHFAQTESKAAAALIWSDHTFERNLPEHVQAAPSFDQKKVFILLAKATCHAALGKADMPAASFRHFMLRRSGFATTSDIDNILIINNLALLLRLDIVSSRLLLSMQAASIDHFEESHIFQGMKQDPRKKEAIMHMDQFLRAKSSLVARAFLP